MFYKIGNFHKNNETQTNNKKEKRMSYFSGLCSKKHCWYQNRYMQGCVVKKFVSQPHCFWFGLTTQ